MITVVIINVALCGSSAQKSQIFASPTRKMLLYKTLGARSRFLLHTLLSDPAFILFFSPR